jgi:hypothetical protein
MDSHDGPGGNVAGANLLRRSCQNQPDLYTRWHKVSEGAALKINYLYGHYDKKEITGNCIVGLFGRWQNYFAQPRAAQ